MQQVLSNIALPLDVETLTFKIYIKNKYINKIFLSSIFLHFIQDMYTLEKHRKTRTYYLYKYQQKTENCLGYRFYELQVFLFVTVRVMNLN
jgi:hypothetical protein